MTDRNPPLVPAVHRALNVLEYVAQNRESVCVKDVAEALDLPSTTAFRLVKQLLVRGYLEEEESRPGYYRLGLQLLALTNGMTAINDLRQIAHAELDRLAVESRQAVQLGVLRGNSIAYIEQILPPNPVIIYTTPYSILPLNISASGKVLAAYSSPDSLKRLLSGVRFSKQTPKTIDSVEAFVAHLTLVLRDGFAVDDEEFALGIGCLAAPVFNHEMRCVAAVGVTGGIHDYRGDSRRVLADMLLRSARAISLKLGMPPPESP